MLLIVIYAAFIGLGLPDSVFGTSWPAIYSEFGLPISYASFVTVTVSICTFLSSLLSGRVINRFGTYRVTAVSTAMTSLALTGMSFSPSLVCFVILAFPLGFGAGAIDTGLNNYVALHYNAMQMNFLHCFYGIGVTASPFLLSLTLSNESDWRSGYRLVSVILFSIFILVAVSLPLWKKTGEGIHKEEKKPVTLSVSGVLRLKGVIPVLAILLAACAFEVGCGLWGSTFLVNEKGMEVDAAARAVTLYYAGITGGRLLSGLLSAKLRSSRIIAAGEILTVAAAVILLAPLSGTVSAAGLFLAGLGIGPLFPNIMHLTPKLFGRDVSQSVIGVQMAVACMGSLIFPNLFGVFARRAGLWIFPYFILAVSVLLIIATVISKISGKEVTDQHD